MKFLNFKRITIFLTSLLLILNSTLANAATIGAWTVSNPLAVGASILYDGSKGSVTSSVLITPNASQVAKVLRGGIAGYALTLAVEQLLGAVDWVLDPANNQIVYEKPSDISNAPILYSAFSLNQYIYSTAKEAMEVQIVHECKYNNAAYCNAMVNSCTSPTSLISGTVACNVRRKDGFSFNCTVLYQAQKNDKETLPLETVAQKVIENAESDNLDA
ncbi:MAG: hypothetical protein RR575_02905 [Acinetobacter sp.]